MRLRVSSVLLLLAVGCSGGDDDGGPVTVFADPPALDFGTVEVGRSATAVLLLTEQTQKAYKITDVKMRPLDQLTFDFNVDIMSVAAGNTAKLEITYHPVGAGTSMVEIVVTPENGAEFSVPVMGAAVEPALLRVDAARVSFGEIVVGSSSMMSANVTNRTGTPGVVTFDPGLNVDTCDAQNADTNNFCVTFVGKTVEDDTRFGIDGNETVEIAIRFIPLDPGIAEAADFELSTCTAADCIVKIELDGSGAP